MTVPDQALPATETPEQVVPEIFDQERKNLGGRPTKEQIAQRKKEEANRKRAEAMSKQTPEVLNALKQAFATDSTIAEACFYAGIAESTYYSWKKENPELMEEIERLRLTPILKARQTVINGLDTFQNAAWFLERKRKDEFSTKNLTEHSGALTTEHVDLTDEPEVKTITREYEQKIREAIVARRLERARKEGELVEEQPEPEQKAV